MLGQSQLEAFYEGLKDRAKVKLLKPATTTEAGSASGAGAQ